MISGGKDLSGIFEGVIYLRRRESNSKDNRMVWFTEVGRSHIPGVLGWSGLLNWEELV